MRAERLEADLTPPASPLWQTLLPVAVSLHAAETRKGRRSVPVPSSVGGIRLLERMGRSLELVSRLIAADADENATPMVAISNRQTAVDILRGVLVDAPERAAFSSLIELYCRPARTAIAVDSEIAMHVLHQRWSQLSSITFARLLLSPEALDQLSGRISEERPPAWESMLPAAKGRRKSP